MPNYKESAISGTKWTRSCRVSLDNPYQGIPSITFEEEQIVQADGAVIKQPVFLTASNAVRQNFTDPNVTFPLLDPATDQAIGTATHGQVYALLYSLYKALAVARDARSAP